MDHREQQDNGQQAPGIDIGIRDYFAAAALPGLLAEYTRNASFPEIAVFAYRLADAMLKARAE